MNTDRLIDAALWITGAVAWVAAARRLTPRPDAVSGVHSPTGAQPKGNTMTDHVDSTSDDRTANNTVRHKYRVLSDVEKEQVLRLKDLGAAFIAACDENGQSREMSLAKTNAEQAVMWAVKHVTT